MRTCPALMSIVPLLQRQALPFVIVAGGSYERLILDYEGAQVAHWLNDRGVVAFVLYE